MKGPSSFGRTYRKTILREIKGSVGRFLAIFAIVALGVGFLAGLLATTPDMKASVGRYYEQTNMMDIFIKASMGFSEDDAASLLEREEISRVMPAFVMDTLVETNYEEILVSRIYGLPLLDLPAEELINRPELLQGRLPQNSGECLVQQGGGYLSAVEIGTVFYVSPENNFPGGLQVSEVFRTGQFTVTGIVKNPLYFSNEREPSNIGNGRLGTVIYLDKAAYALSNPTDLFVCLKGASQFTPFSPAYESFVEKTAETIKLAGEKRSLIRHTEIQTEARQSLSQAAQDYYAAKEEAENELAAAQAELENAKAELAAGEESLRVNQIRLDDGFAQLEREYKNYLEEIKTNEQALRSGGEELTEARITLTEAKAALDAAAPDVARARSSWIARLSSKVRSQLKEYDDGLAAYEDGMAAVRQGEEELARGRRLLEEGKITAEAEFAKAREELENGRAELLSGREALLRGQKELADGEASFLAAKEEATTKLDGAARDLADGEAEIESIELPSWYVLDRQANVSYVNYKINSDKIADVATVFPIFFLLVAALVALTTMTRMVEEERTQIGVLKALGYRKRVIASKYLIYCGLTSVLGSIVGMVSGFQLLPVIIYNAFGTMYHLPPLVTLFNWPFGLIACGSILFATMGTTVSACYKSLREKPSHLLLPRAPKAGKRIFLEFFPFLWSRMKFSYKATARNLLRYKKHFFMTVTGIAGCTALMLTAFGLRDSVTDIARTQFDSILLYDLRIELKETEPHDRILRNFLAGLAAKNQADFFAAAREDAYAAVHSESGYAVAGGERQGLTLFVPEVPERLSGFINLKNRKTGAAQPLGNSPEESVVLTEKLAGTLGVKPGDVFQIENADGLIREFSVSGITENYVGSYIYLSPAAYTGAFGKAPSYKTLFVRTGISGQAEQDRTVGSLLTSASVASAEFTSQVQESYNNLLTSINFVVLILIFAAGGLAMIVLYNLTNININERRRELAALRVLGYYQGEVAAYIFREIAILSLVGTAVGLLLGIPLHRFVISVAEKVDLMFGRNIALRSFLFSAGATLFFSAAVDLIMLKKLRSIEMVDSMKAAD